MSATAQISIAVIDTTSMIPVQVGCRVQLTERRRVWRPSGLGGRGGKTATVITEQHEAVVRWLFERDGVKVANLFFPRIPQIPLRDGHCDRCLNPKVLQDSLCWGQYVCDRCWHPHGLGPLSIDLPVTQIKVVHSNPTADF